ncbi:MAG: hypothetical protein Q7S31_03550, partial [bacterium]|nr:hypothetical protein [bacterium]
VFPLGNPTSWQERGSLNSQAMQIIFKHPMWGVGLGNFVYTVPQIRQPVHNIYLLLMAELGFPLGAYIIFKFTKSLFNISDFKLQIAGWSILALGMVDHYWLTLQQNILLLVIVLALVKINNNAAKDSL